MKRVELLGIDSRGSTVVARARAVPHAAERWSGTARRIVTGLAIVAAMSGCGGSEDNLPRYAVSGKVTLDGNPLERGVISFTPDAQAASPVTGGGVIAEGSYAIPRGQGLTPGKYKVAVTASEAAAALVPGEAPGGPPRAKAKAKTRSAKIPPAKNNAQFNTEAEVKAGGANVFNFELTSK